MSTLPIHGRPNEQGQNPDSPALHRICYLSAILQNTGLLRSTTKLEFLVARALASKELGAWRSHGVEQAVFDEATNQVALNSQEWRQTVRKSLRFYQPGLSLPVGNVEGYCPEPVVRPVQLFAEYLFEGLFPENKGLLLYGSKALAEFANEQARLSTKLCTDELKKLEGQASETLQDTHKLLRVQSVNRILNGKFDLHLSAQGKRGFFSLDSLFKRCCDSAYINKALRQIAAQHQETLILRLGLVSHSGEKYCSSRTTKQREEQRKRTLEWMQNTRVVELNSNGMPETDVTLDLQGSDSKAPLTLADCTKTAAQRFSKLYTFVQAIDKIAQEEGLCAGLLTFTMPPEFHPNPMHGPVRWNNTLPNQTNRALGGDWKQVLQSLDKRKIGITGLRVVEPHQDGCPHWHVWINYRPEFEKQILAAVMSEFPGQLKLRTSTGTLIYNDVLDFEADICVSDPDTQASARLDFAVIDRSISSGATYLMKYLLKTMDVGELDKKELDQGLLDLIVQFDEPTQGVSAASSTAQNHSFEWGMAPEAQQAFNMERSDLDDETPPADFRIEEFENARRVDAYRKVWKFRAFDFFGLARCLGVWDELRRLTTKPQNTHLAMLWSFARGGMTEGRIAAGAKIQGKAVEFIRALGCMRAVSFEPAGPYFKLGLLKAPRLDKYGDDTEEVIGLILFEMKKQHVKATVTDKETGEVKFRNRLKWVKTEITSLMTKTKRWALIPLQKRNPESFTNPQPKACAQETTVQADNASDNAIQIKPIEVQSMGELERILRTALDRRLINKALHLKIDTLYRLKRQLRLQASNA